MKKSILRFSSLSVFSTCFFALLCPTSRLLPVFIGVNLWLLFVFSSVGYASPQPATDVHFCRPLNLEDMRARDSIYAATKHALNLNVGEPRTVRMIYFLPNDRSFRQEVVDSMKVAIRQIQTFYAEQMQAHGYGNKTFRFETDTQGDPMIHRVDGQYPDSHYLDNTSATVYDEVKQVFDTDANNVYLVVIDNSIDAIGSVNGRRIAGVGGGGRNSGSALVPGGFGFRTAAHELGHAFGLKHDFNDNAYIMSYGGGLRHSLSACNAEFLAVHPYFNPSVEAQETPPPTIKLTSPLRYPAGSRSVSIQLKVSDSEGLHQVLLFVETREPHSAAGGFEVKLCRGLLDAKDAVVEFDYDGVIPSSVLSSLSEPLVHLILVEAVDSYGNVSQAFFVLSEISPYHIATLEGHTDLVSSVSFSPSGKILASGATDYTVRLWDVETRENTATLRHTGPVYSVSFSPDGTTLASGSAYDTVKLWDVATRTNIATFEGHKSPVWSVAFSPDGTTLASGGYDGTVRLWDIGTRANIATLEGHRDLVSSVSFSPNGKILVSGAWDNTVKLWNIATRENIATLRHTDQVHSVVFSPDGTTLASAGRIDGTVRLWDVETKENIATLRHTRLVTSVSFSPDGTTLASGASDTMVRLWDIGTRENIATISGHTGSVYSIAFSPDGTTLASVSEDGTIKLWDVSEWMRPRPQSLVKISGDNQQSTSGVELANPFIVEVKDQYDNPLSDVQVMFKVTKGDGKLRERFTVENTMTDTNGRAQSMLTLGPNPGTNTVEVTIPGFEPVTFNAVGVGTPTTVGGDYRKWHLPDGAIIRIGKGRLGTSDRAVAISPDGQHFAVASGYGVWLYDAATLRELALFRHTGWVNSVAFSPDGKTLASGSHVRTILWDIATGRTIATLDGHTSQVNFVAYSPNGTMLASGSSDDTVKLWDVATGTNIATLMHTNAVNSVAFSPDNTMLASGAWGGNSSGDAGSVWLWDVSTRRNIATLEGHKGTVTSVDFSPNMSILASGSYDGTIKLWDVTTRTNIATLEGHTGSGYSVAFSSDGTTLASGSYDGLIKLWDIATQTNITTLYGHKGSVNSVAFSPDGTTLVSGGEDGVRVWDVLTQSVSTLEGHSRTVFFSSFSPDGTMLAAGIDRMVKVWNVHTGSPVATFEGHTAEIRSVSFSPDGITLASASYDNTVKLWNILTGRNIATFTEYTLPVVFSPDGTILATRGYQGIELWDVATGHAIATLKGHTSISSVVFSPDGMLLASASHDNTIKLWNILTGRNIATFEVHTEYILSVVFSPDGTILASRGLNEVELWDISTGRNITNWSQVYSMEFSPDGTMLALGANRGSIELREVSTGRNIATLEGHTNAVRSVVFSPDGTTLASGSQDNTVKLWDVMTGRTIATFEHSGVSSIMFSPDGMLLASRSDDGTVLLWDMSALGLGGSSQDAFSLSLDGDGAAGDQAVTSLDVSPGSVVSLQVFGKDIQSADGISVRFEYDAMQVVYEGFDPGDVLPNAQVLALPSTNPTAIEVSLVYFGGKAAVDSGLVGSVRFLTTSAFSGTTLRLVRAELGHGGQREEATFDNTSVVLQLAILTPDFNGDGQVGFDDFVLFVGQFGLSRGDEQYDAKYDLDEDGTIGFGDFLIFGRNFGKEG